MANFADGDPDGASYPAVLDWYHLHQDELARNWQLIQAREPLNPIQPLE